MNIINEIYNNLKENCVGVYLTGSHLLDYLTVKYDEDYVFLYKDEESMHKAIELFHTLYNRRDLRDMYNIDIHFRHTTLYNCHYHGFASELKTIIGDNSQVESVPGILDDIPHFKQVCLGLFNSILSDREKFPKIKFYKRKSWYYIYRMAHIINNNSYELSDLEISDINILHDRSSSEELRKPIIDQLIKEIQLWQI